MYATAYEAFKDVKLDNWEDNFVKHVRTLLYESYCPEDQVPYSANGPQNKAFLDRINAMSVDEWKLTVAAFVTTVTSEVAQAIYEGRLDEYLRPWGYLTAAWNEFKNGQPFSGTLEEVTKMRAGADQWIIM